MESSFIDANFNETRDYTLKTDKSMKKKLSATERNNISVKYTGGGVRFQLNSGTYELFKSATQEYFSVNQNDVIYQRFVVADKKGSQVECRYKAFRGKQHLYTLNLYHTTSSCLVNGKSIKYFMDTDLPNLFEVIDQRLEGSTVEEVNISVRNIIEQYFSNGTDDDTNTKRATSGNVTSVEYVHVDDDSDGEVSFRYCELDETDTCRLKVQDALPQDVSSPNKCNENIDVQVPSIIELLGKIQTDLSEVKSSLARHVRETSSQFSQLHDEIDNVKKRYTLHEKVSEDHIKSLTDNVTSMRSDVSGQVEYIQRKFESLSGLLKQLCKQTSKQGIDKRCNEQQTTHNNTTSSATYESPVRRQSHNDGNPDDNQNMANTLRHKTLFIGSSMLKGVKVKGLQRHVTVSTNPGAETRHIINRLQESDLSQFKNVIVYIGGNDLSNGRSTQTVSQSIDTIISTCQSEGCNVFVCTLCPRRGVDVVELNELIKQITRAKGATCIDVYSSFIYGNGLTTTYYYHRDGIHLNTRGTNRLVHCVDIMCPIIYQRNTSDIHDNNYRRQPSSSYTNIQTYRDDDSNRRRTYDRQSQGSPWRQDRRHYSNRYNRY